MKVSLECLMKLIPIKLCISISSPLQPNQPGALDHCSLEGLWLSLSSLSQSLVAKPLAEKGKNYQPKLNLVGGFNPSENISQIRSFPQVGVNIKNIWIHHLEIHY